MTTLFGISVAAFLFHADHSEKQIVEHVAIDASDRVVAFTIVSPNGPLSATTPRPDQTIATLRALFISHGENAVRERLGLAPLPLQVWTDDTDTYVGASLDDVRAAIDGHLGEPSGDFDPGGWIALDDAAPVTIFYDDTGERAEVTKTAAEWAASNGRGFLCSTEC